MSTVLIIQGASEAHAKHLEKLLQKEYFSLRQITSSREFARYGDVERETYREEERLIYQLWMGLPSNKLEATSEEALGDSR